MCACFLCCELYMITMTMKDGMQSRWKGKETSQKKKRKKEKKKKRKKKKVMACSIRRIALFWLFFLLGDFSEYHHFSSNYKQIPSIILLIARCVSLCHCQSFRYFDNSFFLTGHLISKNSVADDSSIRLAFPPCHVLLFFFFFFFFVHPSPVLGSFHSIPCCVLLFLD
ncbi:hypothetical protein BCR41DRAFT_161307 [Lobosporangium transversale]|uniref:Uncharacterized protein n=1 Tax=Lobosporangium transversale TaxID=64571 RepID=A0A1Y2GCQ6_9FUNG|nr:hypothetical protein BCR41DRAFT_161307 [Lobosporangium transversale]ORZ07223.1 hypothetical protein BCR41DRAFT_161307 [Lobosporangium transversale]|eukprot:XP_021877886.1 hypothetical protein BCR41DRAFT_161307 [Lobosporangium transversale]